MGFMDNLADVFAEALNNVFNPPSIPSGPLIARPAEGCDLSRFEGGIMNLYFQRSTDYNSAMDVRKRFDAFLGDMLVVEKNDKIVGYGAMRLSGALNKGENCVTMLTTDPNENGFEIAKILIGGFARQALAHGQKTLNIVTTPGNILIKRVCDSFQAARTYVPVGSQTMTKYAIENLTENFVREWEDDQDKDNYPKPPCGPNL